jgi:hypothetical protein
MIPHTGSRTFSGLGLGVRACPKVRSENPGMPIKRMNHLLLIEVAKKNPNTQTRTLIRATLFQ